MSAARDLTIVVDTGQRYVVALDGNGFIALDTLGDDDKRYFVSKAEARRVCEELNQAHG